MIFMPYEQKSEYSQSSRGMYYPDAGIASIFKVSKCRNLNASVFKSRIRSNNAPH